MKKPLKIILWIAGILLGLIILGVAAYLIYFFRATSVLTFGPVTFKLPAPCSRLIPPNVFKWLKYKL